MNKRIVVGLSLSLVLVAGACGSPTTEEEPEAAGPSLSITSPSDGESVGGNVVELAIDAQGLQIVKADGDTAGVTGHFHMFIDREPVLAGLSIPKEPGIVHSAENPIQLAGLSPGEHTFTVVLGDGAHVRLGDAQDAVKVMVDGPALDASTPAELAAGEELAIDIKPSGFEVVGADKDQKGADAGHLHVIIDPASLPVADGKPIPKDQTHIHTTETSVKVAGLAPGEHTIWVVAGDFDHTPFSPLVADKLTVTVR